MTCNYYNQLSNIPDSVPANTQVIWHLSPEPLISTLLDPSEAIVQLNTGTMFRPDVPKQIGNSRIFGWYNLFWLEIIKDAYLGRSN
jgi:hypothetical protein